MCKMPKKVKTLPRWAPFNLFSSDLNKQQQQETCYF